MNASQEEFILRESAHNRLQESETEDNTQVSELTDSVEQIPRDQWQRAPSYTRGISQPLIDLVPPCSSLGIQVRNSVCERIELQ